MISDPTVSSFGGHSVEPDLACGYDVFYWFDDGGLSLLSHEETTKDFNLQTSIDSSLRGRYSISLIALLTFAADYQDYANDLTLILENIVSIDFAEAGKMGPYLKGRALWKLSTG